MEKFRKIMKFCRNIHKILIGLGKIFVKRPGKVCTSKHLATPILGGNTMVQISQREVDHVYFLEERKSEK